MMLKRKNVKVLSESYSVIEEDQICFRFEFDVLDVALGEVTTLMDRESLFYRVLVERGWISSESMEELFEYDTSFKFSERGRVLEIRCKKFRSLLSPDLNFEETEETELCQLEEVYAN